MTAAAARPSALSKLIECCKSDSIMHPVESQQRWRGGGTERFTGVIGITLGVSEVPASVVAPGGCQLLVSLMQMTAVSPTSVGYKCGNYTSTRGCI